jgi:O-antigen biosynthesis protein
VLGMACGAGAPENAGRVCVDGKHLRLGSRPFRIRGATYGTFAARGDGALYPATEQVRADFQAMARAGLNTVRTYTVPPPDIVELGEEQGLRFIVGVPYDDWRMERRPGRAAHRRVLDAGRRAVEVAATALAGRASVIAISVGNEVPADVLRVHGTRSVERVLERLVSEVHAADPAVLATYTNFPTTEYLRVRGQDIVTFNVFLERPEELRAYLRRLMVLAGELPVVITEAGLACGVHGVDAQAASLDWQLKEIDEAGAAGATVFAWTDDWVVAGARVDGWGFGLTDADRRPKPALDTVARWTARPLRGLRDAWPEMTAVVCVRNGAAVIDECLASLAETDYPGLEVIVCDDGSEDETAAIAGRYPFRVLRLPPGGLSRARNAGLSASRGEIVAYIDADARCHRDWPYFLALSLEDRNVAATGGPNLACPEARLVERAVAASPGNPTEVLVSHDRAEHVPGCNMAFRRDELAAIGGFQEEYTVAGDDVDVCWKLLDRDREIAFAPAAQVMHHRRATVRGFFRQQVGYGRAEGLLAKHHRHRFNRLGQARWSGFVYGGVAVLESILRPIVYHGRMGTAAFQPTIRRRSESMVAWMEAHLPLTAAALPVALLGLLSPWWLVVPACVLLLMLGHAGLVARGVRPRRNESRPLTFRALVALLHLTQPFVRAGARALTRSSVAVAPHPVPWRGDREAWLAALERELAAEGADVRSAGPHAEWDIDANVGPFVSGRITTAVVWSWEPHVRLRLRPRLQAAAMTVAALLLALHAPLAGLACVAVLAAAAALEASLLRNLVRRVLHHTTAGADVSAAVVGSSPEGTEDDRTAPPPQRVAAARRGAAG